MRACFNRWRQPPRLAAAALAAIVLVGLGLRFYHLTDRSLWFDEAFSWRLVQFPLVELVRRVGQDNHPPLYFLLLKGWVSLLGDSVFALRSLSVLLGGLTIVGTYLVAAEAFGGALNLANDTGTERARGRGVGLLAATFVAVSVFQVRFAWEVRMYTLATALGAFASWALLRALRQPGGLGWWVAYALLALLLAYTHYYGLFTVAAQAVFVAGFLLVRAGWDLAALARDRASRHALLAAAILVAGWLPWMPTFLRQRAQVRDEFWTRDVKASDVARVCFQMFVHPEHDRHPSRREAVLTADLCLLTLWALRRKAKAGEWYVMTAAVGPLVFCLLASALGTNVFGLRYFLIAHLFLLVGLAALVWRIPWAPARAVVAAVLLLNGLGAAVDFWTAADLARKPGARAAADYLDGRRGREEPVVVCSPLVYFSLLYHSKERGRHFVYADDHPFLHYHGSAALTGADLITVEQLRACVSSRVWVVDMVRGYWGSRSVPVPPEWVEQGRHAFAEAFGLGEVIAIEYATTAGGGQPPFPREPAPRPSPP